MAQFGKTDCEGFARRDFLKIGAAGLFGLSLPQLLQLEAQAQQAQAATGTRRNARATSIIMVWLAGGPATIDMWDMKPELPKEMRSEFQPVATSVPGVQVCEHLPRLARLTDRCTLVRSVHHKEVAHAPAVYTALTGIPSGVRAAVTLGDAGPEGPACIRS